MSSRGKPDQSYQAYVKIMEKRLATNAAWPEVKKFKSHPTNDRADVLVLSSILEHSLEKALSSHFTSEPDEYKNLFISYNDNPLLGSFSSKITLGFHLGLFPEWVRERPQSNQRH